MAFEQLHEILDDKDKQIYLDELKQVIYELKRDCNERGLDCLFLYTESNGKNELKEYGEYKFYSGEQNAFQIVLDLLEHLKENN